MQILGVNEQKTFRLLGWVPQGGYISCADSAQKVACTHTIGATASIDMLIQEGRPLGLIDTARLVLETSCQRLIGL